MSAETAIKAQGIATALRRLGRAYRMDWSDFDGRSLRDEMNALATALESDDPFDLEHWTFSNGICPEAGTWFEHCDNRPEGTHTYSCHHAEVWIHDRLRGLGNGSDCT